MRLRSVLLLLPIAAAGCNLPTLDTSSPSSTPSGLVPGPGIVAVPTSVGPTGDFPDLTVDKDMLGGYGFGTEYRLSNDCAVVEGCIVANEQRRVLRFDVGVMNKGNADLHIGSPGQNPQDFEWSPCHGHYHFKGFAKYELADATGVVATGAKRAFCLMDIANWDPSKAIPPNQEFDCGDQGIHMGYEDVYDRGLDCQWVDITDVLPGDYTLSVTVNAENRIQEKGDAPNTVSIPVTIN